MERFKIYDGRSSFWQWDLEQKIVVPVGVGNEVHFSNENHNRTPVCDVYEQDGIRLVNVPNFLLQEALPLTVYAYARDNKGERTTYADVFSITERPKPDDYVYTETEIRTWKDLDERIKALEKGGGAEIDPEYVRELVEEYLKENPPAPGKDGKDGVDGQPGKDGADGKDGITPEFSIGEVETLPAGSEATASITGTKENPVLNLGIPKGEKGADGAGGSADIPSALPNPHKLTFTGAVNAEYDGSTPVEVEIPAGGGGGEWESYKTITLDEEVTVWAIGGALVNDQETDEFASKKYKEVLVHIAHKAPTSGASTSLLISVNNNAGGQQGKINNVLNSSGSSSVCLHIARVGESWTKISAGQTGSYAEKSGIVFCPTRSGEGYEYFRKSHINLIRINQAVGAGSVFTIWGRR